MQDRRPRALIADGDDLTRRLVSRHLLSAGFDVVECGNGHEVLDRTTTSRFDLIALDGSLSGLDGIALCRVIRQGSPNLHSAIVMVSASAAESDKVLALANGADDYLTKPLSIKEFLARVSAVMRRAERSLEFGIHPPIDREDFRLDPAKRQVLVRGQAISCSKQEFDLLYALASSPGVVFSRQDLLARCWRPASLTRGAAIRLVDPIVSRLRRKIERQPDAPRLILTVWGIGYKFAE